MKNHLQPEKNINMHFSINYHTQLGQNVLIVGNIPELGLWNPFNGQTMDWHTVKFNSY